MKSLITTTLLVTSLFCRAQEIKQVKTFFIKSQISPFGRDERKVDIIDSADFIRTVSLEKNNENLYDITDYYLDKNIKSVSSSTNNNVMPTYAGNVISYYKNGKKESEELYVTGRLLGGSTYYSKNGTIKKKVFYSLDNQKNRVERTEELNDSLGKPFLDKDGTGIYNETDEDGQVIEGQYLNGLKDKEWKTLNSKINETYFDEYDKGKYIKGKTIEANGNIINYDDMEKLPEFNGGLKAFGSFLGKNLRYPAKARDYNIQGRVYLSFVVDKDGDLINLKVVKGVDEELDNEALRVMKMFPKWNPGTQRGRAVKVSYTVPIFFQLQTSSPSKTKHFGSYR